MLFRVKVHQGRGSVCITKVGVKIPCRKIANDNVSGAGQDCQIGSHCSLKEMFPRDGTSQHGAAKPTLLHRSKICLLEVAVLGPDKLSSGTASFQSGKHHPARNT